MKRFMKAHCIFGIIAVMVFYTLGPGSSVAAENASEVGTAVRGVNAVDYIGVIKQDGPGFLAIGYLTYVSGLDQADLYTDPTAPDASTARFTFSGNASLVSHAQVGTVTQLSAVGPLKIYFSEFGGADFNDPASFSSGSEIAAFDARFNNILGVIAPNEGVSFGTVDTVQQIANRFLLNGKHFKFGHPRLIQRVTLAGRATRSQITPPVSTTEFAATAVTP
jgi:hypothetical protein